MARSKSRRFHGSRALTGKQILDSLSRKRGSRFLLSRLLYTQALKKNRDEPRHFVSLEI
jgi:hypothetical protein